MNAPAKDFEQLPWFHQIDLGDNRKTPGKDDSAKKLEFLKLPNDLTGKSVLDIGCWDGFFSFSCEQRNAKRVLATDHFAWSDACWGSRECIDFAHAALGSSAEIMEATPQELTPERVGKFDLVLYLGVLYHVKNPLKEIEHVAQLCDEMLVLETLVDHLNIKDASAAFYPGKECNGDPTNWWGPNPACVIGMLKAAGFSRVEVANLRKFGAFGKQGRAVFHAWK
ncbi:MAG: DUF1698 domain-containing protein [Verrucomicrobiota bacterium]